MKNTIRNRTQIKVWRWAALAAVTAFLTVTTATAHHGWTGYDESKTLNLTGKIVESSYSNPHAFIKLQEAGENGKTWVCILAPPSRMETRGLTAPMIKEGTMAKVTGYPNRKDPVELRAERITIGDKTVELR